MGVLDGIKAISAQLGLGFGLSLAILQNSSNLYPCAPVVRLVFFYFQMTSFSSNKIVCFVHEE